jgi:hypothetical protein
MSLISSCISLYNKIEKTRRFWLLFVLQPFPWILVFFLVGADQLIPKVPGWGVIVLLAFSFELALAIVPLALTGALMFEWWALLARKTKNVALFNLLVLVGVSWNSFSIAVLCRAAAGYLLLLISNGAVNKNLL